MMNERHIRSWIRTLGAPARWLPVALIRAYRLTLSGWLGGQCRFYPTCSHYAEDAIHARGALVGMALASWRVLRCNPFGRGGIEPAPQPEQDETVHTWAAYDKVMQAQERHGARC